MYLSEPASREPLATKVASGTRHIPFSNLTVREWYVVEHIEPTGKPFTKLIKDIYELLAGLSQGAWGITG